MEVVYSPPTPRPTTAPLRLTAKSPRTSSSPIQFSSRTGYVSPVSIISIPSPSLRRTASNPCRAPTPPLPKRMKPTSVLQNIGDLPCEDSRAGVTTEAPIMAPKTRHGRGKLTGSLGGLVLGPKGRTTSSAESGIRIDLSTSFHSSLRSKNSSSILKSSMEDSAPSPGTSTSVGSPTTRRRWPFTSGSFWPRASHTNHPKAPDSPISSFDSGSSSEDIPIIVEKKQVVPRRGILKNKEVASHQRSISAPLLASPATRNPPNSPLRLLLPPSKGTVTFAPDPRPVIRATLPARESSLSGVTNDKQRGEAGQDRAISELLEGLFMRSAASLPTINEQLDVPQIAIEQEEEDFDSAEVASLGSSSFETSGVDLGPLGSSQIATHRLFSSAPPIFTNSFPWRLENTQAGPILHTKRSSCALPQATRDAKGVNFVAPVTQMPSPPASPIPGNIFPIEEELDANILDDIQDIRTSEDGKLDISALSDDQWTLRAESINDGALDQKSDVNLPRYSELLFSPAKAMFHDKETLIYQFLAEETLEPETSLIDENFALDADPSDSSHIVRHPPTRSVSLALPAARRLRPIRRTDLLVERASQQWDREKVNDDVQKATQRLPWGRAQKAWQLVREAEHAPVARVQIANASQDSVPLNPLSPSLPKGLTRAAMLPPGRLEWATVDSASPDTTGHPGPVFRLCIAWRLAAQYNAINHPFGLQEEIKVFVLGRTHEEFYQFYEGLMGRFMLEPRRHPWVKSEEVGPRARASLEPMERPGENEKLDFGSSGDEWDQFQGTVKKVDMLEAWTQGLIRLKGTKMSFVLESDYMRMWMAPRREGDCERAADSWRKDGHGEIGRDSEGIARVLERLW